MRPTERFTSRVDDYRQFRPGYPRRALEIFQQECGLTRESRIADVAAGTGLLTANFLENGNPVSAVEPNAAMRLACKQMLCGMQRLTLVDGTAEQTGLPDVSFDFVTVGQAMHWFDLGQARKEFKRILRPGGWCVVVYNHRRRAGDAFHEGYEELLQQFGRDYVEVQARHLREEKLAAFFAPCRVSHVEMSNDQELDMAGLMGRIASSSYMPTVNDARYEELHGHVASLFDRHQRDGLVVLENTTKVSFGRLDC